MSKYREMTHEEVLAECKKYMNDEHLAFVESAYEFAKNAHEGQFRVSGQPYIIHPTQVAGTLATLRLDPDTVAAGYLHDTVEDTPVTNDDIKEKFGKSIDGKHMRGIVRRKNFFSILLKSWALFYLSLP